MRLSALAATVGRSVGYLSQIERGISHPPLKDMVAISVALGVPLSTFLTNLNDTASLGHHSVVRGASRRRMMADGSVNESLIVRFMPNFEYMRSTIGPGISTQAKQSPEDQSFEFGVIIEGTLDLYVNGKTTQLMAGDNYGPAAEAPHAAASETHSEVHGARPVRHSTGLRSLSTHCCLDGDADMARDLR